MKILILIILSFINTAVFAFDYNQDVLCFKNADPEMAEAAPAPWGSFAVKTGACQGIAGISAAFFEHGEFNPSFSKPQNNAEVREIITRMIHQDKVVVPGYKNLKEFCADFKSEFLRAAVLYNRDIAVQEIAKYYPQLSASKGVMKNLADQKHVLNVLVGFEKKLLEGKLPLLLYYKHVVLVYDFEKTADAVILTVYDSNFLQPRIMKFDLNQAQLPELSNKMIWDITPTR